MPLEIERKFLVRNGRWRTSIIRTEHLRDGLVAIGSGHKVRVRSYGDRATLTVKTTGPSITRKEFEYEIPLRDAEDLLENHCGVFRLDKIRNHVLHDEHLWVVDEYEGILSGTTIAEIELDHESSLFGIPDWAGEEVTHNPDFRKVAMLTKALERLQTGQL
jgi:adenylate cyclase